MATKVEVVAIPNRANGSDQVEIDVTLPAGTGWEARAALPFSDVRGPAVAVVFDNTAATDQTALFANTDVTHFGDGSDGDFEITTDDLTDGPFTSGVATRDVYADTVTISGSGAINMANFRLFCKTGLDLSDAGAGAIVNNGNAAVDDTAGAAISAGSLGGASGAGTNGGAGGTAAGSQASAPSAVALGNGGAGGQGSVGGDGSGGVGGALRAGAAVTATFPIGRPDPHRVRGVTLIGGGAGGAGGGGGGGDGTAGGAGGAKTGTGTAGTAGVGGSGGRVQVFDLTAGTATITAGAAGSGTTGGACSASL